MKINYNDPNSVFYKVHDVCTDIKDGIVSDRDATEQLLGIYEQGLQDLAERIIKKASPEKEILLDGFVSFLNKTIEDAFSGVSI
ncbi:hypothetical protein [Paenibacillus sinopodophylli]|uniref:hypothetical protein n=1 Tax=Paenibacillus sinopodophylli TaxID=1837342 RepID=UPI00110CD56D|nr:hypothetical protein [Paenibacillus sinopodophylli]